MSDIESIRENLQKKLHKTYENKDGYFDEYINDFIIQFYTGISKSFSLRNFEEINDFIVENDDLISLLRNVEPIVREYFKNESLFLEFVPDPEIDRDQLLLYICVDFSKNSTDEVLDKIHLIDKKIMPLKKGNAKGKFLVNVESL